MGQTMLALIQFFFTVLYVVCLLPAVPCVPTNVSVMMDCINNTALVSWAASLGAVQYAVTAHSNHSNATCQTSDLTCHLGSLACGNLYSLQVVAMDETCSSIPSQALIFSTGNPTDIPPIHTFILLCEFLKL